MIKRLSYMMCLFLMTNTTLLLAGCGGCQINNTMTKKETNSTFINTLPSNNKINGFVIASCNKCNLGKINEKKCSMGIKIDDKVYSVYGFKDDHKAAHESDGICNALRIAHVSGKVSYQTFYPDTFTLLDKPN